MNFATPGVGRSTPSGSLSLSVGFTKSKSQNEKMTLKIQNIVKIVCNMTRRPGDAVSVKHLQAALKST